jgi:hypothetical protein
MLVGTGYPLRPQNGQLTMLEQELHVYDEHLSEWLGQYRGRFVLVKGAELVGVFNTVDEALAEGARRFGLSSFLVRRVEPVQEEVRIPALTLGLLRADSTRPVHRGAAGA